MVNHLSKRLDLNSKLYKAPLNELEEQSEKSAILFIDYSMKFLLNQYKKDISLDNLSNFIQVCSKIPEKYKEHLSIKKEIEVLVLNQKSLNTTLQSPSVKPRSRKKML